MMNRLLHQFFILHKKISIAEVGSFAVEKKDAFHDFAANKIYPAIMRTVYSADCDEACIEAFTFFAKQHANVSRAEVEAYFLSLRNSLDSDNRISLAGIGLLQRKEGESSFEAFDDPGAYLPPVTTTRVMHNDAIHDIRVGEQVKTNTEMRALLSGEDHKSYWWVYALLILLFLAGCACLYYYYFYRQ